MPAMPNIFLVLNNSRNDNKFYASSDKYRSIRTFEINNNKLMNFSTFVLN